MNRQIPIESDFNKENKDSTSVLNEVKVDSIREEVIKSIQEVVTNTIKSEVDKSIQEVTTSIQEEVTKSIQEEVTKSIQEEVNKSAHKEYLLSALKVGSVKEKEITKAIQEEVTQSGPKVDNRPCAERVKLEQVALIKLYYHLKCLILQGSYVQKYLLPVLSGVKVESVSTEEVSKSIQEKVSRFVPRVENRPFRKRVQKVKVILIKIFNFLKYFLSQGFNVQKYLISEPTKVNADSLSKKGFIKSISEEANQSSKSILSEVKIDSISKEESNDSIRGEVTKSSHKVIQGMKAKAPAYTSCLKTSNRFQCLEVDEIKSYINESTAQSKSSHSGSLTYDKKKRLEEKLLKSSLNKMDTKNRLATVYI